MCRNFEMSAMVEVERPTELQVLIDTQLGRYESDLTSLLLTSQNVNTIASQHLQGLPTSSIVCRMFRNSQRIPRESGTFRGISTAYEMCCMEVPETTN